MYRSRVIKSSLFVSLSQVAVYIFFATVFIVSNNGLAWGQWQGLCSGYWIRTPDGYGYQCVPAEPQCPTGTSYCANTNRCCNNSGSYCSKYGCTPYGAVDCGTTYCNPGQACTSNGGCMPAGAQECSDGTYCKAGKRCWIRDGRRICVSEAYAYAHKHAKSVVSWLYDNKARFVGDFDERHQRALEYVAENDEVREKITNLFVTRASSALYGPAGDKAATVLLQIRSSISSLDDFRYGRYHEGILRVTNQASSILLEVLPYGGTSADVLSVGAAVGTAYAYGFFWGE